MVWDWVERCRRARRWIETAAHAEEDRLIRHQNVGAHHLQFRRLEPAAVSWVAGVDCQIEDEIGIAATVLLRSGSDEPVMSATATGSIAMPYRYGFLGFRELGPIFAAMEKLGQRPDLVFYDGNGALHPRGFGAASQFALYLGVPTIGVSKNVSMARLNRATRGEVETIEPGRGGFLTTRSGVKPVCVSPGHLIDLESSYRLVLDWSRMRVPDPIRLADQLARQSVRVALDRHVGDLKASRRV